MSQSEPAVDLHEVTDGGERVIHLRPNDCYYAHLSIYAFAVPFARGAAVLDAGCGTGYGSHYLAGRGAKSVTAVDASAKAIDFCRATFVRDNLDFRVMDLEKLDGLPERHYDLIFSSNVLEHLDDAPAFFRAAGRLLKPGGALIAAVPPIINEHLRNDNLSNLYHLNIWSPRQWHHVLAMYFGGIQYYGHLPRPGLTVDFSAAQERSAVTEADFVFAPVPLERMGTAETLTSVFVARRPLPARRLPDPRRPLTFVDDSFTRRSPFREYPPPPPEPLPLARRAWHVARRYGPWEFVVRSVRFPLKRLARLAQRQ